MFPEVPVHWSWLPTFLLVPYVTATFVWVILQPARSLACTPKIALWVSGMRDCLGWAIRCLKWGVSDLACLQLSCDHQTGTFIHSLLGHAEMFSFVWYTWDPLGFVRLSPFYTSGQGCGAEAVCILESPSSSMARCGSSRLSLDQRIMVVQQLPPQPCSIHHPTALWARIGHIRPVPTKTGRKCPEIAANGTWTLRGSFRLWTSILLCFGWFQTACAIHTDSKIGQKSVKGDSFSK